MVCLDGCDPAYLEDAFERGITPRIAEMAAGGLMVTASSQLPSFTNPNNLSIVTGAPPSVHGIPGNHFRAPDGNDVQLTDPGFLRAPSIYASLHAAGVPVLVVTTKEKLRRLLSAGDVPCVSVERAEHLAVGGWHAAADAVGRRPRTSTTGMPLPMRSSSASRSPCGCRPSSSTSRSPTPCSTPPPPARS